MCECSTAVRRVIWSVQLYVQLENLIRFLLEICEDTHPERTWEKCWHVWHFECAQAGPTRCLAFTHPLTHICRAAGMRSGAQLIK
jgi:hypothetical protein